VGQEPDRVAIRVKQRGPDGRRKEFDAYAVTEELVFLNSTKATLRSSDVDGFLTEIATFRAYFPEYRTLPLVGILTTLAVEESVLSYAEKQGFLVLAVGDEVIEVKDQALSKPSLRVPPKPVPTLTPQAALRQTRGRIAIPASLRSTPEAVPSPVRRRGRPAYPDRDSTPIHGKQALVIVPTPEPFL
jgi:hypothetical protein